MAAQGGSASGGRKLLRTALLVVLGLWLITHPAFVTYVVGQLQIFATSVHQGMS